MLELLTPSEAAQLLHVAPTTIRHWSKIGKLPFIKTPGGHRRYNKEDLLALLSSAPTKAQEDFSILIVDDDKDFNQMLYELLKSYFPKIKIKLAFNGFEAGDLLHTFSPDLILLDLFMSDLNGFSVCKKIKSSLPLKNIHIITITGALTETNIKKAIEAGADKCIGKPLDYLLLKKSIEAHIQAKHP